MNKKEMAMELVANMPNLTPQLEKECRYNLRHYLTCNKYEGYCTACEQYVDVDDYKYIGHRQNCRCPICGAEVEKIDVSKRFSGNVIESQRNVIVFLSSEDNNNLYIRCFTIKAIFQHNCILPKILWQEAQAYIFTDKSAFRFGHNHYWNCFEGRFYTKCYENDWTLRTKFTMPVFYNYSQWRYVNTEAIKQTVLSKSGIYEYSSKKPMRFFDYYKFYKKQPGIERLSKAGLISEVDRCLNWGTYSTVDIDFTKSEPHKMMGVTKDVMRAIRDNRIELTQYKFYKENYPKLTLEQIIQLSKLTGYSKGSLSSVIKMTGLSAAKLIKYLKKQNIDVGDYWDYLNFAKRLNLDLTDEAVLIPSCVKTAHDRLYAMESAIKAEAEAKKEVERNKKLKKLAKERKVLEFSNDQFIIRQPLSAKEIIDEGKILSHCVGGYADRHVDGKLNIMFLRKKSEPDKPYYTIEVSNDYKIVQCRGYKNNWVERGGKTKPPYIVELEKQYQEYLNSIKRKSKTKERKTA